MSKSKAMLNMYKIIEKIPRGLRRLLKVGGIICLIVFVLGIIPDKDRVSRDAIKENYGLELPPMIAIRIGEFKGREEHVALLLGQVSDSQMEKIEKEAADNANNYPLRKWFLSRGFYRKIDWGRFGCETITIMKSRTVIVVDCTH